MKKIFLVCLLGLLTFSQTSNAMLKEPPKPQGSSRRTVLTGHEQSAEPSLDLELEKLLLEDEEREAETGEEAVWYEFCARLHELRTSREVSADDACEMVIAFEPTAEGQPYIPSQIVLGIVREATASFTEDENLLTDIRSNDNGLMIVSDIHGSLDSVKPILINFLDKLSAGQIDKLVFLGDYTDRGAHNTEVITLVCTLKMLFPENVYLLRGNHEDVQYQLLTSSRPTLFDDYIQKYVRADFDIRTEQATYEECSEFCDVINDLYTKMPALATISCEGAGWRGLCVHAGIPRPLFCDISMIGDTRNVNLRTCNSLEKAVLEDALWNELDTNIADDDFHFNEARGGGHKYGHATLLKFLRNNGLSFLVNGHIHRTSLCMIGNVMKHAEILSSRGFPISDFGTEAIARSACNALIVNAAGHDVISIDDDGTDSPARIQPVNVGEIGLERLPEQTQISVALPHFGEFEDEDDFDFGF